MSAKDTRIDIGGIPRADLLPPELALEKKSKAQRTNLLALFVVVVIAVAAVYGFVAFLAASSQASLDAASAESANLLGQQAQFLEVRQLAAQVDSAKEARQIGTSTEIDWELYKDEILGRAPEGTIAIASMVVNSATPITPFEASSIPLEGPRVAEVTITGIVTTPDAMANWLTNLEGMTAFADAKVSSITSASGVYTFNMTVHINDQAFTNRFAEETNG